MAQGARSPGSPPPLLLSLLVALLVFAVLELLVQRAGVPLTGELLLAQFAPLAILVLRCTDGTTLRRLSGLSPPLAALLDTLGWPRPERYLPVHA